MKKIVLISVLSIMCFLLYNTVVKMDNKSYNNEVIEKKTNDYLKIDFNKLQEKNKDIIGWLIIKDTDINYPILKGEDNEFYRFNDSNLLPSKSGSIFQNFSEQTLNEKSITLFGNNLNKGMFADLRKIHNQELGKDIYAKVITEDYIYTYKVYETKKNNIISDIDFQIDVTNDDYILNLKSLGGTFEYVVSAFRIGEEAC